MELVEKIFAATKYIRTKTDIRPEIDMILGSGLGDYGETLEDRCWGIACETEPCRSYGDCRSSS